MVKRMSAKKSMENYATWQTNRKLKSLIKNKKLGSLTINVLKSELKRRKK